MILAEWVYVTQNGFNPGAAFAVLIALGFLAGMIIAMIAGERGR